MLRYLPLVVGFALLFAPFARAAEPGFAEHVAPILMKQCLTCHNAKKAEGGYRVDTYRQLLEAGDSGAAPVTGGDAGDSELLRRISSHDEFERMPLEGEPLPAEQIELIGKWIAAGAACDENSQDRPLAAIVPPPVYRDAPSRYRQTLPITALAFSPDGSQLLVGGYHEITVWNVADGALVRRIGNVGQRVYAIDLDANGQRLAVACGLPGRYGEALLIDAATGDVLRAVAGSGDAVFDARFDPDGERLAVASADASVRIYRAADGELLHTITSHSDWVTSLAWSRDGKRLAAASRDKTAKVLDAADGRSLITYAGHDSELRGIAFHPDGKRLYSAADRELHRWKIADAKREKETKLPGNVLSIAPLGNWLLVAADDDRMHRIAVDSGDVKQSYEGHADWVLSAAGHLDSGRVAAGAFDGRVIVWELESGKQVSQFIAAPGRQSAGD